MKQFKITYEELLEAIESYWGRKKTGQEVKVKDWDHEFDDYSATNNYLISYEDVNP